MTFLSRILLSLAVLVLIQAPSAQAATTYSPTMAYYFVKDATSPTGYKEQIQWEMTNATEWENFYKTIPVLPKDTSLEPDPFLHGADDIVVLSRTDVNRITGFDIYLSSRGLTLVTRGAQHYYYPDSNGFRKFLEAEQGQRSSFDSFEHKEIDPNSKGIIVTYNVNQNIPNPTWLINKEDDQKLYDSFLKALKPHQGNETYWVEGNEKFDGFDLFVLYLNYPGAPTKIATVNKKNIRLSNPVVSKAYFQDTEDYFTYFKTQAREMMEYRAKYKSNESKAIKRSRF